MKMKKSSVLALALLMLAVMLFTACTGGTPAETAPGTETPTGEATEGNTQTATDPATEPVTEPVTEPAAGIIRIALLSDVHIGKGNTNPENKFRNALAYLANLAVKPAAVGFTGDITDRGYDAEYTTFMSILNAGLPEGTVPVLTMGNHEYFRDGVVRYGGESAALLKQCQDAYKKMTGSELRSDTVIGGMHILAVSVENSAGKYTEASAYLVERIKAAVAEDPQAPIVILTHESVSNMAVGTAGGDDSGRFSDELVALMKQNPQIIHVSGHTHYPLEDPRAIMQNGYTSISNGTVGADFWNSLTQGQPENAAASSQGLLLDYDAEKHLVTVRRVDFTNSCEIGNPWVIDMTAGKAGFTYNDSRKNEAAAPVFPSDATATVTKVTKNDATFAFTRPTVTDSVSDGMIYSYTVEVFVKATGKKAAMLTFVSDYHLGTAAPANASVSVGGLPQGTEYTFRVTAQSVWGKVTADALTGEFRTSGEPITNVSMTADLLNVDYRTGSADDTSGRGLTRKDVGNPTISKDSILGQNVAVLNTDSAYAYALPPDVYTACANTITMEALVYIEDSQIYPWGYVNVASNTEAGGFGLNFYNNHQLEFSVHTGAYQGAGTVVNTGKWLHLVGTYDGSAVRLYINGELVAETPTSGPIHHVTDPSRWLFVGADVNGQGDIQTSANVRVAYIRLYSQSAGIEQVTALWNASGLNA